MNETRVVSIIASLVVAAMVAGAMVLADAPTWAWLGVGLNTYLLVKPEAARQE